MANGHPPLAVFDLDSTLFDVTPRLEKILTDFAFIEEHRKRFPEHIHHFANVRVERRDWGIRQALIRAGLDGQHPELQECVRNFWVKNFFSNNYLQYDIPYPGAVNYVQKLHLLGANIVYLTGRDVERMGQGSYEVLRKWQFPLGERAELVLKPHKDIDDGEFKRDWFLQLPKDQWPVVWFFENEPVNIELVRQHSPHVQVVFFDSTHSGKSRPPEDIPAIMDFLLHKPEES
ncbi:MAG: HAD family hydrolase [Bdellovibrionaceae bacterium]|nr:HAD family hydrolase [Pseudobdellovibrionaceae bacterium]